MSALAGISTDDTHHDSGSISRRPVNLWDEAVILLNAKDKQQINTTQTDQRAILEDLLEVIRTKEQICVQKQRKLKKKSGEVIYLRDILSNTVKWVKKFKEIGDTLVQYDPGHAALPWAAIRFILQAAVNENEIHGAMLEGVDYISSLIARCTTVEILYLQKTSMEEGRLRDTIVHLYVAILQYLLKSHHHFSHGTGRRALGSIIQTVDMKVEPLLKTITKAEDQVNLHARLIDAEFSQKVEKSLEGGFTGVHTKLDVLSQTLQSLQTSVDTQPPTSKTDRRAMLSWLAATSTVDDYERAIFARTKGTCEWILTRQEYQSWESPTECLDRARLLWIRGSPSFGKTILCASIIQHLQSQTFRSSYNQKWSRQMLDEGTCGYGTFPDQPTTRTKNQKALFPMVAYFFCSFEDEAKRQPSAVLRSWISQIVGNDDAALNTALASFRETGTAKAAESDLWLLLETLITQRQGLFLIVDGFDECVGKAQASKNHAVSDGRADFIKRLAKYSHQSESHILFISRENPDMRIEFEAASGIIAVTEYQITQHDTSDDIQLFSESVAERRLITKSSSLKQAIATEAAQKCEGMFLWVRLLHDRLSPSKNAKQLHEAVQNTPPGLEQAYERELDQILSLDDVDRDHAPAILRWVLFATRPLTVRELTEALMISLEGGFGAFPDEELPDSWDDYYVDHKLKKPCGSLVDVRVGQSDELSARTVGFVHFSVKEYLCGALETRSLSLHGINFSNTAMVNDILTQLCLRYLLYVDVCRSQDSYKITRSTVQKQLDKYGFLSYAGTQWPIHVSYVTVISRELDQLLSLLFDLETDKWRWWAAIFNTGNCKLSGDTNSGVIVTLSLKASTPLYHAALLGLTTTMRTIEQGIQRIDDNPTQAEQGIQGIDGNPTQALKNDAFREAIRAAAEGGQPQAVQFLIEHSARSPFQIEVPSLTFSSEGIWSLLTRFAPFIGDLLFGPRRRGVAITKEQLYETMITASLCKKAQESESIIRLCLSLGAKPRNNLGYSTTALHGAATRGATNVIRLLLDRGMDVDPISSDELRPLHLASEHGHIDAVKLLLSRGASVNRLANSKDSSSTPLHRAAGAGHNRVIQTLIAAGADVEAPIYLSNEWPWTPLYFAVMEGHDSIVEALLHDGACIELGKYVEALMHRSVYQPGVVSQLLVNRKVGIDAKANGYTALHRAACGGSSSITQELLGAGADIDVLDDCHGRNPIHFAAFSGSIEILEQLISRNANILCQDSYGRTALHYAVAPSGTGDQKCRLITWLVRQGLGPGTSDHDGNSPLHYVVRSAVRPYELEVVQCLIESGADVEIPNREGQRPLHLTFDSLGMTSALLNSGAKVDPADYRGATPLWYAAEIGAIDVIKCLLDAGADVNARILTGHSALDRALSKMRSHPPGRVSTSDQDRLRYGRWRASALFLQQQGAVQNSTGNAREGNESEDITYNSNPPIRRRMRAVNMVSSK